MNQILVIRFSALGDVALTVPVLIQFLEQNKETQIVMLTKKHVSPLFANIERLITITPDLSNDYKGLFGLIKLFKYINTNYNISKVIDLHDVIRTKILRFLFKMFSIKTFKIDKGRKEKRLLVSKKNKVFKNLKHTSIRYVEVFTKAGYSFELNNNFSKTKFELSEDLKTIFDFDSKTTKIGIAPFAFHKQKMYPLEKMEKVIEKLNDLNIKVYIFGGGIDEKELAQELENKYKNTISLIGKIKLKQEISIISNLNLMLTMDSANMHLTALTNTKLLSIWGSTHKYAGFTAFGNLNENNIIEISESQLNCRPCSIYGKKKCFRKDIACLNMISPEIIVNKILENIELTK